MPAYHEPPLGDGDDPIRPVEEPLEEITHKLTVGMNHLGTRRASNVIGGDFGGHTSRLSVSHTEGRGRTKRGAGSMINMGSKTSLSSLQRPSESSGLGKSKISVGRDR